MTNAPESKLLGDPVDRVDGPLKVTGAAPYPSDVTFPGLVHAALAQSTIAAGTISRISTKRRRPHRAYWPSSRTRTRRLSRKGR
jgi:xanthine dehydrogenase YagR molybdenum-binding subunit